MPALIKAARAMRDDVLPPQSLASRNHAGASTDGVPVAFPKGGDEPEHDPDDADEHVERADEEEIDQEEREEEEHRERADNDAGSLARSVVDARHRSSLGRLRPER